jgi:precorrin-2/cobalt-factor-2 C20-methyltransferase
MKVGRHLPRIRTLLGSMGLTKNAGYIERASMGAEHVSQLPEAPETAPYFSMILIYKGDDPWLN